MIFRAGFGLKAYPSAVTEYGDQIFVRVERRIDNNLNVWRDGEDLQQLKSIEDLRCINVMGPEIRPSFRAIYDDSIPDNWPSHFLKLISYLPRLNAFMCPSSNHLFYCVQGIRKSNANHYNY
jgi:hypothetical protein